MLKGATCRRCTASPKPNRNQHPVEGARRSRDESSLTSLTGPYIRLGAAQPRSAWQGFHERRGAHVACTAVLRPLAAARRVYVSEAAAAHVLEAVTSCIGGRSPTA